MAPTLPTWFKYRQGKAEPLDERSCRVSAPNLPPAVLAVRQDPSGRWAAVLRLDGEPTDHAASAELLFETFLECVC
jgi:hypothetical protein